MLHVHVMVGTDTYGRVKAVERTSVITKFSMVQMLPVWPIESYYVWGPVASESAGIPLLVSVQEVKVSGVPLARVDLTSVVFAYIRGALAASVLVGFLGTFLGLMMAGNGRPPDEFARTAIFLAQASLAAGIAGGVLTYLVPTASRRERAIRTYCGELLGVRIDPARIESEYVDAVLRSLPPDDFDRKGVGRTRSDCLRELILTRCDWASETRRDCEAKTDELLNELRHADRIAAADNAI